MNKLIFLTAVFFSLTTSCSNQNKSKNADNVMTQQKITPCLWVETKDAKAVADYYLSLIHI